jgi:hypothetical protein
MPNSSRIRRPRKLPWPASRIERDVLHSLWLQAQRTRQPITAIIKAAVDIHLSALLDQQTPRAAEPAKDYHAETSAPAA